MPYATSGVQESQLPYQWWINPDTTTTLEDGTQIVYDPRNALARACDTLETRENPLRDNCIVYDLGGGGLEIRFTPIGWQGADKLKRQRYCKIWRPAYESEPSQEERRRNPFAETWEIPAAVASVFPVTDNIVRRPTGAHPGAGTSPNYQENRLKNARRAKARVRRIIRKYFKVIRMWTLTFEENVQSVKQADKEFRKAMRALNDWFKSRGKEFKYVAVREFQKRGAIHYHVFVNQWIWKPKTLEGQGYYLPEKLLALSGGKGDEAWWLNVAALAALKPYIAQAVEADQAQHKDKDISMDDVWVKGHTWVSTNIVKRKNGREVEVQAGYQAQKQYDFLGSYLSKYIVKTLADPEANKLLEGHHLYLRSNGLNIISQAVWTSLTRIYQWIKRQGRKIRQQFSVPVTIETERGAITFTNWRFDTT